MAQTIPKAAIHVTTMAILDLRFFMRYAPNLQSGIIASVIAWSAAISLCLAEAT